MNMLPRVQNVPIGEVATINPKGPGSGLLPRHELLDFLPMADLSEDGTMAVSAQRPYADVAKGYTAFRHGDILLAKITPCFENNKIGLAEVATEWAFGSTEFHVIRPGKDVDARYLLHFLRQDMIRTAGEKRMTGSGGQRRVPKSFLEELPIPLPPLAEQKRIAAVLDQADALRRLRRRALDRLNTLGQAIFQEMFGDLVSGRCGFPRACVQELIEGFETGKNIAEDPDANGEARFRILKVSAVTSGFFRPEEAKPLPAFYDPPASHIVRDGDLLFSRANTEELIGATAFVRGEFTNLVLPDKIWRFVWRRNSPVLADFVKFLFDSAGFRDQIRRRSTGTSGSMKNISQAKVLSIAVGLPPLDRQGEFSERLDHAWMSRERSEVSLHQMEILFASLQHRAFTGQL